ncbi:MAG TPA: hypothetical protein VEA37_04825 [Flavobacterium sp.]|nr:hypothetical protein [Flavobacterium sp.]
MEKSQGSFMDRRVIMWHAGQATSIGAFVPEDEITAQQSAASPIYLCIGKHATDDSCMRAATKYNLPLAEVIAFRNKQDFADPLIS